MLAGTEGHAAAPVIASISPTAGAAGDAITIAGSNFGTKQGKVVMGGKAAKVSAWDVARITATAPAGQGAIKVLVKTAAGKRSNTLSFTYNPFITAISPTGGLPDTVVKIVGSSFGSGKGTVWFDATPAKITVWKTSVIKALVPAGSGRVAVTVQTAKGLVSAGQTFTYNGATNPTISAISPASGTLGTVVNLSGSAFGSVQGTVLFGTTPAAITSWSSTRISAAAPAGQGTVNVTVKSSTGLSSNSQSFNYVASGLNLTDYRVFANNDLGMHCVDKDFSVFSILPPYNVLNAQVIGRNAAGKPVLLNGEQVTLRYSPVAYNGAINTYSRGKTNFWSGYGNLLYGTSLLNGQGLKGLYMPGDAPANDLATTSFSWHTGLGLFAAEGVPIFPSDDPIAPNPPQTNPYPMLRITAYDKANGATLAATDIVVPVSGETTCNNCHATGQPAASRAGMTWSNLPDLDQQARTNILLLHDANHPVTPSLASSTPVLCAGCHYSPALDLGGVGPTGSQTQNPWMSAVMHSFHAGKTAVVNGKPLYDAPAPVSGVNTQGGVPPADQQSCYQCHPGIDTKCLRGAMTDSVTCQNCHGDLKAVGAQSPLRQYGAIDGRLTHLNRRAWSDEPRCQSCHTGDATDHLRPNAVIPPGIPLQNVLASDGIRFMKAFDAADPAASPLLAVNQRFAENDGQLFRHSKGHGGIACEGCHGSTHAIWPGDQQHPKDNLAAEQLQGHAGTVSECSSCHATNALPANTQNGPHGMHLVNDSRFWQGAHEDLAQAENRKGGGTCAACHGADHQGTVLSRVPVTRTFNVEGRNRSVPAGQPIACDLCHSLNKSFEQ